MGSSPQSHNERILRLVGAIVLASQDAEGYLKVALPFLKSGDPGLGAALKRAEKIRRQTLGQLTGMFVEASSSDSPDFPGYLERVVEARNQVVHHFNEIYGPKIASGAAEEVVAALEAKLDALRGWRAATEQLALAVLEALRDNTFRHTPQYEQMVAICDSLRRRVEN